MTLQKIYPILAPCSDLPARVELLCQAGVPMVQWRDKGNLDRKQLADIVELCAQHNVILVVNDDLQLCRQLRERWGGCIGLHVGKNDTSVEDCRSMLRECCEVTPYTLGVSCYGSQERRDQAIDAGATHVSFGAVFATSTKLDATPLDHAQLPNLLDTESDVQRAVIGGISSHNIQRLSNVDGKISVYAISQSLFGCSYSEMKKEISRLSDYFGG